MYVRNSGCRLKDDTWRTFSKLLLGVSAVGLVAGGVAMVCHMYKRLWTIVVLTATSTVLSLFLLVQAAINLNFESLCEGNAGFVQHGGYCMAAAAIMVRVTICTR